MPPKPRTDVTLKSKLDKGIALSLYADLMGCTINAVKEAIESGKIDKGVDRSGKKPKIFPDIATIEWARNHAPEKIQNKELKANLTKALMDAGDIDPLNLGDDDELDEDTSLNDADRIERIYKAKIRKLDYEKLMGIYVLAEDVKKSQFAVFQALRVSLQAIPEATVDKVMTAKTRKDAVNIMRDAIEAALLKTANLENIEKIEVDEDE